MLKQIRTVFIATENEFSLSLCFLHDTSVYFTHLLWTTILAQKDFRDLPGCYLVSFAMRIN